MGQTIAKMMRKKGEESNPLSFGEIVFAGAFSAFPTTIVMAPMERVKCLLQLQGQKGVEQRFNGMFDCGRHLLREGGVRSLFKGWEATLMRDVPGSVAYFASYEMAKKLLSTNPSQDGKKLSPLSILVAGGIAGKIY